MSGQNRPSIPVLTPWTTIGEFNPAEAYGITSNEAAWCDFAFRTLVNDVIQCHMPWLPEALHAAGALVVGAAPGIFEVVTADGQHHHIPDLARQLQLVPWRMPGEPSH